MSAPLSVGYRIYAAAGGFGVAAYLIDDVSLVGIDPASAGPANLLTNGDFEADEAGTASGGSNIIDATTLTGWRFFAISGANGSATVSAAAASSGTRGLQLARSPGLGGPDRGFDHDINHFEVRAICPTTRS